MNQFLKKFMKFIFVKKRVSTSIYHNKFFSTLHTLWLSVALFVAFLDTLGVISSLASWAIVLIHLILVIRNINQLMFVKKQRLIKVTQTLLKFSILIFIFNVIMFTWSFAFAFFFIVLFGRLLYVELPQTEEKMKQKDQFKQQFGDFEGPLNETNITNKHIENLFEQEIALESIDEKTLKKQFRSMAKIYHPDKNNGEHDDRFHSIKQSYDYLKEKIPKSS